MGRGVPSRSRFIRATPRTPRRSWARWRGCGQKFGLSGVVLVGDRGMLTQPQIDRIKQQAGWGWITAFTKRSNFVYTKISTLADPRSACASCGLRANPRVGGWRAGSCDWEQFRCTWDRLCTSSSSCQRSNEYIHGNILLRSAVPNPHIMNGLV
jgi:hypothetical protein